MKISTELKHMLQYESLSTKQLVAIRDVLEASSTDPAIFDVYKYPGEVIEILSSIEVDYGLSSMEFKYFKRLADNKYSHLRMKLFLKCYKMNIQFSHYLSKSYDESTIAFLSRCLDGGIDISRIGDVITPDYNQKSIEQMLLGSLLGVDIKIYTTTFNDWSQMKAIRRILQLELEDPQLREFDGDIDEYISNNKRQVKDSSGKHVYAYNYDRSIYDIDSREKINLGESYGQSN